MIEGIAFLTFLGLYGACAYMSIDSARRCRRKKKKDESNWIIRTPSANLRICIRTYEEKGLIKPYRTKGGTRRYSQEDVDKLIQIANLSQRGINLDGIKIIYVKIKQMIWLNF